MSRPDDYRGAPPGGSWRPGTAGQSASPTGWVAEPGRPPTGPGWSTGANGPAGAYPPADGGSFQPIGGAGSYPPAGAAAPRPTRNPIDPAKLLGIIIAALGAMNFVFGFLPQVTASRIDESLSVYAVGPGYVPILLLIAGLLALAAFLPGSERSRLAVAAVSVGGAVGALISLGTSSSLEVLAAGQVSKGLGAVLLTIFGIIQAVVAIAAYVVGADLRAGPRSSSAAEPSPGGGNPPAASTGWAAAAPAPAWSAPPAAPSTAAPEPGGSVGYYAGYAPVPGSAGPGGTVGSSPTMSNWGPPADDDRPTGPQQPVVDPDSASTRRSPAERELPRVAPGWPDQLAGSARPAGSDEPGGSGQPGGLEQPLGTAEESDASLGAGSRHAAADDQTRTAPPPVTRGPDEGVTEVYRIPPRSGPEGPAAR
jgi:hypothetical protein